MYSQLNNHNRNDGIDMGVYNPIYSPTLINSPMTSDSNKNNAYADSRSLNSSICQSPTGYESFRQSRASLLSTTFIPPTPPKDTTWHRLTYRFTGVFLLSNSWCARALGLLALVPVALILGSVNYYYLRHFYFVGPQFPGPTTHQGLNKFLLQMLAKFVEVLMVFMMIRAIVTWTRIYTLKKGNAYLGLLTMPYELPDPLFLFSGSLWGLLRYSAFNIVIRVLMFLGMLGCFLLAFLAAPMGSALMSPDSGWWPAGGSNIWLEQKLDELFPTLLTTVAYPGVNLTYCRQAIDTPGCPTEGAADIYNDLQTPDKLFPISGYIRSSMDGITLGMMQKEVTQGDKNFSYHIGCHQAIATALWRGSYDWSMAISSKAAHHDFRLRRFNQSISTLWEAKTFLPLTITSCGMDNMTNTDFKETASNLPPMVSVNGERGPSWAWVNMHEELVTYVKIPVLEEKDQVILARCTTKTFITESYAASDWKTKTVTVMPDHSEKFDGYQGSAFIDIDIFIKKTLWNVIIDASMNSTIFPVLPDGSYLPDNSLSATSMSLWRYDDDVIETNNLKTKVDMARLSSMLNAYYNNVVLRTNPKFSISSYGAGNLTEADDTDRLLGILPKHGLGGPSSRSVYDVGDRNQGIEVKGNAFIYGFAYCMQDTTKIFVITGLFVYAFFLVVFALYIIVTGNLAIAWASIDDLIKLALLSPRPAVSNSHKGVKSLDDTVFYFKDIYGRLIMISKDDLVEGMNNVEKNKYYT